MTASFSTELRTAIMNEVTNRERTGKSIELIAREWGISSASIYEWQRIARGEPTAYQRKRMAKAQKFNKRNFSTNVSAEVAPAKLAPVKLDSISTVESVQCVKTEAVKNNTVSIPSYVHSSRVMRYFSKQISALASEAASASETNDTWRAYSAFSKMRSILRDFDSMLEGGK